MFGFRYLLYLYNLFLFRGKLAEVLPADIRKVGNFEYALDSSDGVWELYLQKGVEDSKPAGDEWKIRLVSKPDGILLLPPRLRPDEKGVLWISVYDTASYRPYPFLLPMWIVKRILALPA